MRERFESWWELASGTAPPALPTERLRSVRAAENDPLALACEAARQALGLYAFDEQILAALALADGHVAEMATGEGKTLAAMLAASVHAMDGRRVHVLTVNDYLAQRDAAWMGPAYAELGLSVGFVVQAMSRDERRAGYACDVTYVNVKQAGFDFLRDSRVLDPNDRVQGALDVAIVDEADSILIDEARLPLVLAGRTEDAAIDAVEVASVVRGLSEGVHYTASRERRSVELTDAGLRRVEAELGVDDLYAGESGGLVGEVANAVHAAALLERDVDYIVREGRVEHVDELTGRVARDRLWPDGLQAALEAKEGVRVQPEGCVLNSITILHFLRQYAHLSGTTGTAVASREELHAFWGLYVMTIPRHRPSIRIDHPDRVLATRAEKRAAVLAEIATVHASGRPVLVGTVSVAESELLAQALRERGVPCEVLNAKNDEREADIVAEAGRRGAVTISTNMAGRGTDIRLGGHDEQGRSEVAALGGLHVVGTSRHESPRTDEQLRGRVGRQGDPGSSRFFVSLEDELVRRYAATNLARWPLDSRFVRREIDRAQRIVDGQNFEIRKSLLAHADLVDEHRARIHGWRLAVLCGDDALPASDGSLWPTDWLAEACAAAHAAAVAVAGIEAVRAAERELTLRTVDRHWGEHLARLTELRASVHLNRYAGRRPLEVYRKEAADAFDAMVAAIEHDVVVRFERATLHPGHLSSPLDGLETPSSTWTYIVGDQLPKASGLIDFTHNPALALYAAAAVPFLAAWRIWKQRRRPPPSLG